MYIHKFCTHLLFKTKYFINQLSQLFQTNRDILYINVVLNLKFKANDLKGSKLWGKSTNSVKAALTYFPNA